LEGLLRCERCDAEYEVRFGIPHLKPAADPQNEVWKTWRQHLEGFEARRELRESSPSGQRAARWSNKMKAFAQFVDAPAGNMLDVGCGPGNLRRLLDPQRVQYFGIDPIPVDEVSEFPFVCGIAEALPFRSGTFSSMVVRSALDHFCDLHAFFEEAARVLADGGRIYLEQVVHGSGGVGGLVRHAVHAVKDVMDDVKTRRQRGAAPKHMREFSQSSLMDSIDGNFNVEQVESYTSNWYTPTQLFVRMQRGNALVNAG